MTTKSITHIEGIDNTIPKNEENIELTIQHGEVVFEILSPKFVKETITYKDFFNQSPINFLSLCQTNIQVDFYIKKYPTDLIPILGGEKYHNHDEIIAKLLTRYISPKVAGDLLKDREARFNRGGYMSKFMKQILTQINMDIPKEYIISKDNLQQLK